MCMTEQEEFSSIPPVSRAGMFQFSMQSLLTWIAAIAVALAVHARWHKEMDAGGLAATCAFGMLFFHAAILARVNDSKTAAVLRTVGMLFVALGLVGLIRLAVGFFK